MSQFKKGDLVTIVWTREQKKGVVVGPTYDAYELKYSRYKVRLLDGTLVETPHRNLRKIS